MATTSTRSALRAISNIVRNWETGSREDRECLEAIAALCLDGLEASRGVKVDGLDLGTLSGILEAQRAIDNQLPVISARHGLLQELQNGLRAVADNEAKSIELMNALLSLQAHCRTLSMTKVGR